MARHSLRHHRPWRYWPCPPTLALTELLWTSRPGRLLRPTPLPPRPVPIHNLPEAGAPPQLLLHRSRWRLRARMREAEGRRPEALVHQGMGSEVPVGMIINSGAAQSPLARRLELGMRGWGS